MNILRRATTRQVVAGLIAPAVIAGGSAAALAGGRGPEPPHLSLAAALHRAAESRLVQGVAARVKLANNLLSTVAV